MEDDQIVSALIKGQARSVEKELLKYANRLKKTARFLSKDEVRAEDLVQETFAQVFKSIHRFKGTSSLYTWCYAILLNLYRQDCKKLKNNRLQDPITDNLISVPADQEKNLNQEETLKTLKSIIDSLNLKHREIIVLRYFEGLKIDDISKILRISKGTAKSRIHFALKKLKKKMPPEMNLSGCLHTN